MADWVVVVDDDSTNLKMAGHILSKHNKRVTALKSGRALLDYIQGNVPDIILLDINMPEMDGFETLQRLRDQEKLLQMEEIPVIFLTAEDDISTESRGFEMGVSDYIRKPFDPDILIKRIDNILGKQERLLHFQEEASRDKLTGLLNKSAINDKLTDICQRKSGYFLMIDLDSFKLVNDLYGHEMGDKVLIAFSETIKNHLDSDSIIGRIGGDEFVAFSEKINSEEDISKITQLINDDFLDKARSLMGNDMDIPLGASIGAMYVSGVESEFGEIFKSADRALYKVKENGKHGYAIYKYEDFDEEDDNQLINLKSISMILAERNISNTALQLEKDSFIHVYRFVMRYIMRYHRNACKLLFTLSPVGGKYGAGFEEICDRFCTHTREILRKSDLVMQYKKNQFFIFLTDIKEEAISQVIGNIIRTWNQNNGDIVSITYETEFMESDDLSHASDEQPWVVVVDDDITNLKLAGHVLSRNNMRVTALKSGRALLDFLKENRPNLILLDVRMPDMDGYETMTRLMALEEDIADIPVIFLTASDDEESEKKGLALGAIDFVRKPFVPEVLVMRVKQIIEMVKLQKNLAREVDRKTKENEELFIHVVKSLADAIDAKDTYTNGHSGRVAEYSREIAKRYGYNTKEQSDIYMMGLLHDVGKIGVPDVVINKPGRLTDEEFEQIKRHPVIGDQILKNIQEMPSLSIGARWHHERYNGEGYPDGLKGDEIPEAARIIAVADAYDAMTSYRSYRDVMSQEVVRAEIMKCSGTQFDPKFAEIMVRMIDEDTDYDMREKKNE
ncbi:diguanylate cyclase (GGDEF) domain-containing protein [Lachnospiraceae bacterium]|nr:diguanylate cyclase (GGDEF) domain-containing protein [Lachnospiraceae bacterium]